MSDPPRVGLLFGGRSVEHEVSVDSARNVAAALEEARFVCVPLAVTGEGHWLSPELSRRLLVGDGRRAEPAPGEDDGARIVVARRRAGSVVVDDVLALPGVRSACRAGDGAARTDRR